MGIDATINEFLQLIVMDFWNPDITKLQKNFDQGFQKFKIILALK